MKFIHTLAKFLGIDWGVVHLKHGTHDIVVPTKINCPGAVWVRLTDGGRDGCANAPKNSFSYRTVTGGVEFFVDVETDCCKLEWFVVGDE